MKVYMSVILATVAVVTHDVMQPDCHGVKVSYFLPKGMHSNAVKSIVP